MNTTNPFYLEIPFGLFALQKVGGPLNQAEGTYEENPELEPDKYKGKKVALAIFEPGNPQYLQTKVPTYNLRIYQKEIPDADEIQKTFKELKELIETLKELVSAAQTTAEQAMQMARASQSTTDET